MTDNTDLESHVTRTLRELQTRATGRTVHEYANRRQVILSLWGDHQRTGRWRCKLLETLAESHNVLVQSYLHQFLHTMRS